MVHVERKTYYYGGAAACAVGILLIGLRRLYITKRPSIEHLGSALTFAGITSLLWHAHTEKPPERPWTDRLRIGITMQQFEEIEAFIPDDFSGYRSAFSAIDSFAKAAQEPVTEALANAAKNRYPDVLPYDRNRVVIDSGYINASWIDEKFILTQGPLPSTVDDFLAMLKQYKAKVVISLGKNWEKGIKKFETWWLKATVMSEVAGQRTIFTGCPCDHIECRQWQSDMPPNKELQELLQHLEKPGPIVIHCSAGAGRSGTLLALHMLQKLPRPITLKDVARTVWHLRTKRMSAVEDLSQFKTLCDWAQAKLG